MDRENKQEFGGSRVASNCLGDRENKRGFGGSLVASNLSEYGGYVNFIGQVAARLPPPPGGRSENLCGQNAAQVRGHLHLVLE